MKNCKINLYDDLFEKQTIPDCVLKIGYRDNDFLLYSSKNTSNNILENKNFSIQIIPKYLDITYHPNLRKMVVNEFRLGYVSKLNEFQDVKSYVLSQYQKNAKPILKKIKRLETCFNINYTLFFGDIDRNQYDFLMESLKGMLTKRFIQRNDSNYRLNEWKDLHDSTYDLIKQKKASLFVIYNNDEPIQINLQYHFKDILISSIASYNIDYQVFGLGNTAVYKQIEWCINNNYTIYDQGHGDLPYKRRWSNLIYNFDHHIVYSKNDLMSILKAYIEYIKVMLKGLLRKKKVDYSLKRMKDYFSKKKPMEFNTIEKSYKFLEIENFEDEFKSFSLINWKSIEYEFLIRIVYDFLYYNFEHYNDIEVYQNNSQKNKFIFRGKNSIKKIVFS